MQSLSQSHAKKNNKANCRTKSFTVELDLIERITNERIEKTVDMEMVHFKRGIIFRPMLVYVFIKSDRDQKTKDSERLDYAHLYVSLCLCACVCVSLCIKCTFIDV